METTTHTADDVQPDELEDRESLVRRALLAYPRFVKRHGIIRGLLLLVLPACEITARRTMRRKATFPSESMLATSKWPRSRLPKSGPFAATNSGSAFRSV